MFINFLGTRESQGYLVKQNLKDIEIIKNPRIFIRKFISATIIVSSSLEPLNSLDNQNFYLESSHNECILIKQNNNSSHVPGVVSAFSASQIPKRYTGRPVKSGRSVTTSPFRHPHVKLSNNKNKQTDRENYKNNDIRKNNPRLAKGKKRGTPKKRIFQKKIYQMIKLSRHRQNQMIWNIII
jgi:hypothetical protein